MSQKFCYLSPDFPTQLYAAMIFLAYKDNLDFHFMYETFTSPAILKSGLKNFKNVVEKKHLDTRVYGGIVLSLKFHHLFSLKKEYWQTTPSANRDYDSRATAFLKMFNDVPQFYYLAITPQHYYPKTKSWLLSSWMPFKITTPDDQIEYNIKSSDHSVSEKANSFCLYSIEEVRGIDITTGTLYVPSSNTSNC